MTGTETEISKRQLLLKAIILRTDQPAADDGERMRRGRRQLSLMFDRARGAPRPVLASAPPEGMRAAAPACCEASPVTAAGNPGQAERQGRNET